MSNFVSNENAQALMKAIESKKLTVADTMPAASPDLVDKARLYIGPDITGSFTKGVTYQCQALEVTPTGSEDPQSEGWYIYNSVDDVYELTTDTTVVAGTTYYTIEWVGISSAEIDLSLYKKIWGGSSEAWEQLTDAEKAEYEYMFFDDDSSDAFAVVDAVTKNDMHPVTSNAVAVADEAIDAEISDIVNVYGAKNLLPYPFTSTTSTIEGVTFTDNGDGSVGINGTATDTVFFGLYTNASNISKCAFKPNTTYILTLDLENASDVSIYVNVNNVDLAAIRNKASGHYEATFTTPSSFTTRFEISYYLITNVANTNAVAKAMIRLASIKDNTYESFAMPNLEITKRVTVKSKTYTGLTTDVGNGYILTDIPAEGNVLSILPSTNIVVIPYRNMTGAPSRWCGYVVQKWDTTSPFDMTVYYTETGGMP